MENWMINLLPSIMGGLVASSLESLVRALVSSPLRPRAWNWRRFTRNAALVAAAGLAVLTYLPPYSVSWTEWCLAPQGTTRVMGGVVRFLFRTPVSEVPIQVKLFPSGTRQALQAEEFGTSDWNGSFSAELSPPQPGRGMYLVNTAYNYDSPLWTDRWYIKDFRKANPPSCGIPKRLAGTTGALPRWGSGWLDLETMTDFAKGDRLRLTIGGTANRILVRLLSKGISPDESAGIVGRPVPVPKSRTVEVTLDGARKAIVQISVHGGPNPWGQFPLGADNGPATLEAVEFIPR